MMTDKTSTLLLVGFSVLLLCSCRTSRNATDKAMDISQLTAEALVSATSAKTLDDEYLTGKMSFRFQTGSQDLRVGGHLRMKKDDVIQLSFVALGIVEAARMEFTPKDVLVIDRMNKRYIKAAYDDFTFLKEAGIDFNTLQSLFRNAIFLPKNHQGLTLEHTTSGNATVLCQNNRLRYKFLMSLATHMVQQTQILPVENNKVEFNWIYGSFTEFNGRSFPLSHTLKLQGMGLDSEVDIVLKNLGNDSKWDTRTAIKSSWKEMTPSDLLKMIRF